ncbi:hemolysin family protein [Hoyosella sp. YIM 151337]|uniref:hemolysin family protein n=1 Tax=Hoyosella sp. YIM 151337 TaxID=2992742 RepID=UPI002235E60E|nr:hemolysin family protein [Hoyosella sp. YIM 151337]MCW4355306.1 hemolysin family protein [Hoyosella sp. YIM 151337]
MTTDVLLLSGVLLLILFGGAFAAIDAALNTLSLARIEELVQSGQTGAQGLMRIVHNRPQFVNLTVLLRVACEIAATVLLAAFLLDHFDKIGALAICAGVMVVVSFVLIGVGPRTLGRQHAYAIAIAASVPLRLLGSLLGPLMRLMILLGNAVTPGKGFRNGPFASEIELRELVDLAQERGVVAADEHRMIQSVFELGDTIAREVMVPRTEMVWIEEDKNAGQATTLAVRSGHSRIPVIGENIDDIRGVIFLKDLVRQTYTAVDGGRSVTVRDLMRPAVFVPDTKPLDSLLREMQRDRNHMVVLVDEYGGIAGIVTIEDILEEIVGEIADEYDVNEQAPVEALGDGVYRVSARLPIEDLGDLFRKRIEDDEVETVGGLIAHVVGRVPLPGTEVDIEGLHLVAEGGEDTRGRVRVHTILVTQLSDDEADESRDRVLTDKGQLGGKETRGE